MKKTLSVFLILLVSTFAAKLPSEFKKCKAIDDEANNKCIGSSIDIALQHLGKNGIPNTGVPILDPLDVKEIVITQGGFQRPVSINMTFSNNKLYGVSNYRVKSLESKVSSADKFYIKMTLVSPNVNIQGPYDIAGNILVLPISGNGQSNMTFENIVAEFVIKGESYTKKDKEYVKITALDYKLIKCDRLYFSLTNLFNGNKALGDNMNKFLNDNWKPIFDDLSPSMDKAMSKIYFAYIKAIFAKIPYNDLFEI